MSSAVTTQVTDLQNYVNGAWRRSAATEYVDVTNPATTELLARTPVDELEVRSRPRVIFRVDEVTWLDAIVRYLVPPREAGAVKTRLIPKLLAALNDQPERVMFPKGDAR